MANDPLSLPDDAAAPRTEADERAVQSAAAMTERGRPFLTEYPSHQTETQRLLATIDRLRTAALEQPAAEASAAFTRALTDVAGITRQIEAMLAANAGAAPDVYFAVELIQDIAMALRLREIDAALCDGLDAAIREIGDAVVRQDAAATRVTGAAALLGELRQRVDEMITRSATSGPSADGQDLTVAAGEQGLTVAADERLHDVPAGLGGAATALLSETAGALLLPPLPPMQQPLPEKQAEPAVNGLPHRRFESALLPVPSPIDETREARQPAEAGPASSPRGEVNPIPRAPSEDPLAVLQTLSEEELIALFS